MEDDDAGEAHTGFEDRRHLEEGQRHVRCLSHRVRHKNLLGVACFNQRDYCEDSQQQNCYLARFVNVVVDVPEENETDAGADGDGVLEIVAVACI